MELDVIDFSNLEIESDKRNNKEFSRVIYHDKESNTYLKIWSEDYYYIPYFEKSLSLGFFVDIAPLIDIIKHKDKIIGYITVGGKPITYDTIDKHKLENLRQRIIDNCIIYKVVYLDFNINNIVEIDDKYYIIDLEASVPSKDLDKIHYVYQNLCYCDYEYKKEIKSLLKGYEASICVVKQHTKYDKEVKYGTANGRIFLEKEFLPTLHGRTLFVGVNYYTDFYHRLVKEQEAFETCDVDPKLLEHGSPFGHIISNMVDLKARNYYDNVVCFGIFGHKDSPWEITTSKQEIIDCIDVLDKTLKKGGTLLLGPSTQMLSQEFWNEIYNGELLKKYEKKFLKQIDINYIWCGTK